MKMKLSRYLALLAIVFTAFSCKKLEPPVVPDDEPDFSIQFSIPGQNVNFAAGVDNYYLFSDFEKTGDGLHAFTGELRNIFCEENCRNSLKIKIYDFELAPDSDININESIAVDTDYEYAYEEGGEDTTYVMTFTPDLPVQATGNYEYIWTIDGEVFSQETVQISQENPFSGDVCLKLVDLTDMCNGNICKEVNFTQTIDSECFAKIIISDTFPDSDFVRLAVIDSEGLPPDNVLWNTGETNDSIFVDMLDTFSFTGNSNGCLISGEGQLNGDLTQAQSVFFCTPDFQTEFEREISPILNTVLGKIVIEYIDDNGVFYSSFNGDGGEFLNFRVKSINSYDRNERDQATVILEVEFSTTVVSEEGNSLEIVEGRGTIGVAYPD